MGTEVHEMESVSSNGKDDDPDFVPKLLSRKSRTASTWQAVRAPFVSNRGSGIVEDAEAAREGELFAAQSGLDHLSLLLASAKRLDETRNRLIDCLTERSEFQALRKRCEEFIYTYLDARITQAWPQTINDVVERASHSPLVATVGDRIKVYEILIRVAELLEHEPECSLLSIVVELRTQTLIKDAMDEKAAQMVFQFVGWLTALFDPSPEPSITHLSLRKTGHTSRRRRLVRHQVVRNTSVVIANDQQPVHRLLGRFGSLLPEPQCVRRPDLAGGLEAGSVCIIASYVSFFSLQQVLNIKLEWVDTLNQHLEFDQSNNVLRVFRLPSLCRLLQRNEGGTLLSRLFRENKQEANRDAAPHNPHLFETDIEDFLIEVLLSYRLIFGRKTRSRRLIGRRLEKEKREWEPKGQYDPLLEILCTHKSNSPEICEVYADLEAREFEDYISVDEFPFLAGRLADLQRFSMAQDPHSWRRLWNDRRNITSWFTTWAVVIIGGGTLLFQVLQLVFQIYQPFN